ncbi:conjugative transposon protein TraK [Parapedobacter defluvii]|uniref:Conjugative transposon protein TraK n=1 Tax=Parapedobacter defluvii TaxID=2045106 RepID=A0ABQ1MLL0_9SPHI|nr:conjugative transposon protein TraK [Parapedobacter defluvii]GGC42647.1 conjugative transposon protein TraK [Parapedobacter defluvii]
MFKQFKNIDTAFRHIKTFSIVFLGATTLLCGFVIYKSHETVERILSSIWVIVDNRPIQAKIAARKDNLEVEARRHVTEFHRLFFTLDPDEKAITSTITKALYLADENAKRQYDNLRESGYYSGLISGNISQRITIDSIRLDMRSEPYAFRCYATQQLIRSSGTLIRILTTTGTLHNVARTDNNPHGFIIRRWETLENRDKTQ